MSKKRLLKPPEKDGEIFILPEPERLPEVLTGKKSIGTCHQPYFFNPGVSLKYLILEHLPIEDKRIIFLDTDTANIGIKVPLADGTVGELRFVDTDRALYDLATPTESVFDSFFSLVERQTEHALAGDNYLTAKNILTFKDILYF